MCAESKQSLNVGPQRGGAAAAMRALLLAVFGLISGVGAGADAQIAAEKPRGANGTATGVAAGENRGGVIDVVHVMAPPGWSFVLETQAGSFVDCGDDILVNQTDADGRSTVKLSCGVTLAETLVIPAAARSARIVIHH